MPGRRRARSRAVRLPVGLAALRPCAVSSDVEERNVLVVTDSLSMITQPPPASRMRFTGRRSGWISTRADAGRDISASTSSTTSSIGAASISAARTKRGRRKSAQKS